MTRAAKHSWSWWKVWSSDVMPCCYAVEMSTSITHNDALCWQTGMYQPLATSTKVTGCVYCMV